MKSKIAIFSSLLCALGTFGAHASDCIGSDCDIGQMYRDTIARVEIIEAETLGKPTALPMFFEMSPEPIIMDYTPQMKSVNVLTVKPVEPDNRAKLWDGGIKEYKQPKFDKTVDWRDGVPIWDDSVNHYRRKDFRDWFLEPSDVYMADEFGPDIQMQVEELLTPLKPSENLWTNNENRLAAQDLTVAIENTFNNVKVIENSDGCPFETDAECAIWRRKPMVRETLSPRSPKIRVDKMDEFLYAVGANRRVTANEPVAAPLLERYKMLMQSANACCTDGMAYQLKQAGASDGLVYKFLADDANFYNLGARCLMMTDADFDKKYPNTATAAVAADVRNGCLCRGRQWFKAMLAPFEDAYKASPEFANEKFNYTYVDGLQREITVSVNNDVQNVLNQLSLCP